MTKYVKLMLIVGSVKPHIPTFVNVKGERTEMKKMLFRVLTRDLGFKCHHGPSETTFLEYSKAWNALGISHTDFEKDTLTFAFWKNSNCMSIQQFFDNYRELQLNGKL